MVQRSQSASMRLQALTLLLFTLGAASAGYSQPTPLTVSHPHQWWEVNYDHVADLVFGDPRDVETGPTGKVTWAAVTRVRPQADDPEIQIVLTESASGQLALRYCHAIKTSVLQQMLSLHDLHPDWNAAEIAKHIPVKRGLIEGANQQSHLRLAARRLAKTSTSLKLPTVIITDASSYDLWSFSGSEWVALHVLGGPNGTDPVIQWIESLRRDVARSERSQ